MSKEDIARELEKYGVSKDYNKPASFKELKGMNLEILRRCYNSIKWSNNLVDVSKVKGGDLEIKNTNEYIYLLTYSFP